MLGFGEIIDHCTQWPPTTRLSSILQYQNLHQDLDSVLLGGDTGSLEAYVPTSDAADLWMMVTPRDNCGAERLHEIKLSYSAATMPSSIADRILDDLPMQFRSSRSLTPPMMDSDYIPTSTKPRPNPHPPFRSTGNSRKPACRHAPQSSPPSKAYGSRRLARSSIARILQCARRSAGRCCTPHLGRIR
ncbi:uncharacterized protein BO95DRAFT_280310 [Aspergillus brunneoviolaceus CBS 621.78]|uniref:Uncharacterized protein n=1 Tax=Aspergillus brunneoviolaceus CBS 621.78 TaxID=1450534 RepID=A0ACD1FVI1_9EURO|nr:hypothetical protein BO95DRAFT_280310 [Aspergillus brunneoviolaceus CBS 621.78]RAH40936.1 hypothetical protein BO95DRAFT_280310 [Aspergillus brunneoviolaceus CBS 621.78]